MAPSKSIEMQPLREGLGTIFLRSQFCTKPQWPPTSTDLSEKVAIVTGSNIGLGFYSCIHLLSFKLSHLILAVRSVKKGEDAASKLRAKNPKAKIEVWELDMESYDSVQAFTRRVETDLTRLDIAILNAGIVNQEFSLNTKTGHEEIIQVNYLSTMLLAVLLLPALKTKSPVGSPGRLTIVNSGLAYGAKFPNRDRNPLLPSFDDTTQFPWDANERYSCSKLMCQLFFVKMMTYIEADNVIVNLVDPGLCKGSGLHRNVKGIVSGVMALMKSASGRTLAEGSSTYVDAAVVKGKESHGCFIFDWNIMP